MKGYRLTPRAYEDLRNIGRYMQSQWGRKQRNVYLKKLEKRLAWLARQPSVGRERNDIQPGYYSYPEGQHVIFYLISGDYIDVIGVPHRAMDIDQYFI